MALKLKYTDEHGIVHINMSPNSSSSAFKHTKDHDPELDTRKKFDDPKIKKENVIKNSNFDLKDPTFDTINHRFGSYDLFGGKYEANNEEYRTDSSGENVSLFRSRYNSIEEELANTPYAFATERSLRCANQLDITIDRTEISPSKDIEDDKFFNRRLSLEYEDAFRENDSAFTVTQLIHAQDRYFDLSKKDKSIFPKPFVLKSTPSFDSAEKSICRDRTFENPSDLVERTALPSRTALSVNRTILTSDGAFQVLKLNSDVDTSTQTDPVATTVVPISVRKKEKSFAILTETPVTSRPSSPRSLPVDIKQGRVSPFKGRGFREETSRHNTPRTSAANSRTNSPPPRRRTSSLSKIDKMASTATLPPPIFLQHTSRNFLKENMEDIREISELNREKHQAEAEKKKINEEAAILIEMGLSEKEAKVEATKSVVASRNNSRTNSRSNSPSKINLRSRSSSPSTKLNDKDGSKTKEYINANDGLPKVLTHRSRVRYVSKTQPQSKEGSPKHSNIPKRQSSVSPKGATTKKANFISRRSISNSLSQSQKYMSSSTSSIHETIRVGSQIHDKRDMSQSAQHLSISPAHIKSKPPISPGRGGPPPSNKTINAKRLSPIVGTPNKSPVDDSTIGNKIGAKTGIAKKPLKITSNALAGSKVNSRQTSRDSSPDKRKTTTKPSATRPSPKPISRTSSTKSLQKPATPLKTEPKKTINRTDSIKSLDGTSSIKNLASKPPLKRSDSKLSNKSIPSGKMNDIGRKDSTKDKKSAKEKKETKNMSDSATDPEEIPKQDNETQYDGIKITNDKGELVIMTKKSIVSMTTAAITSQPLEIVTTVTNQLPTTLEKAREKRNIERLGSKDSLIGKDEIKEEKKKPDKSHGKSKKEDSDKATSDDHKLRPLQPPFNDPQLDKVKQKIDDILKTPEISRENILTSSAKSREMKAESKFKNLAEKTKADVKQTKDSISDKLIEMKTQLAKQEAAAEATASKIRTEATKIVDSIITPVEEPKDLNLEKVEEVKKDIEPIVMVVNEKKKETIEQKKDIITEMKKDFIGEKKQLKENKNDFIEKKNDLTETVEKVNEALVKGEAEVEVQSSNMSTPGNETMKVESTMADGNGSDRSHSNGGFPQSTSTTPKPPARTRREQKEKEKEQQEEEANNDADENQKKPNICSRLLGKCRSKCCPCCVKGEEEKKKEELTERRERSRESEGTEENSEEKKQGMMSKFSCCKKKPEVENVERDLERAAGKGATIEFEDETKRKRRIRDVICCCGRRRRVTDAALPAQNVADVTMSPVAMSPPGAVGDTGCCGRKRQLERRDSILSDRAPPTWCGRVSRWLRGVCRRRGPAPASRRASLFSKNKSLSPTLPPEDTRQKLDPTLVEHTSVIRAAIPILPPVLAYLCLVCNVLVPGLGSIFSGLFCLCFGIPRFGPHDGAKYRIGSFIINMLVGAGQLFTVLFCLVGWGWSIWWGVIMVKISRKYRRLQKEAQIAETEAEAAIPVTATNHTRA